MNAAVMPQAARLLTIEDQQQLAFAASAALRDLGCRVISTYCSTNRETPRVTIDDPGERLIAHLDPQSIDTSGTRYIESGCHYMGCEVYWYIGAPPRPRP